MEQELICEIAVAASVVALSCAIWWLQRRRTRELHSLGSCVRKQHRWYIHDGTIIVSFCNVCRQSIEASIATCFACGACVHESCTQLAQRTIECKLLASDSLTHEHQFMTVNVAANVNCASCSEMMQNDAEFNNVRCSYCHVVLHRSCVGNLASQRCHYGTFREFVIAPNEVRVKRRRGIYIIDKIELRSDFIDSSSLALSITASETNTETSINSHLPSTTSKKRRPLIVIVNRSAGNENDGMWLLHRFRSLLNPVQIYDVATCQPLDVALGWLRNLSISPDQHSVAQSNSAKQGIQAEACDMELYVCICGGDGTVQYVMSTIEKLGLRVPMSFVPIPLGTGNDLARQFGWGGGFVTADIDFTHHSPDNDDQLTTILHQLSTAKRARLDRWNVEVFPADAEPDAANQPANPVGGRVSRLGLNRLRNSLRRPQRAPQRSFVMNNYFSVGLDAAIAFDFDRTRRTQPSLTGARWLNKLWYFVFGTKAFLFDRDCAALHRQIGLLRLGGKRDVNVPELQCLLVLNIANWCAGCRPWTVGLQHADSETDSEASAGSDFDSEYHPAAAAPVLKPARQSYYEIDENLLAASNRASLDSRNQVVPRQRVDDGKVEVLAFRSVVHMGTTRINFAEPTRIGQSSGVTIRIDANNEIGTKSSTQRIVPLQVDGEPWLQVTPCLIRIRRRNQVTMLKRCDLYPSS